MRGFGIRKRVGDSVSMHRDKAVAEEPYFEAEYDETHTVGGYEDDDVTSVHEMSAFVDEIEDLLCSAVRVPLTSKAIVDQEQCLATLDVIRANWPLEVLQAQRVLAKEGKVLEQAELEAEQIKQRAERQASLIMDQNQLVKMADVRAREVIEAAQQEADHILRRAEQDARDVYEGLEHELDLLTRDIKELVAARLGKLRR
jgi:vacuolar-type H+-ATPase subunit H